MPSFKEPSFQERAALAEKARLKALERLKAKPPVDEAVLAERRAAFAAREEEAARASAEKRAQREREKAEKLAQKQEALARAEAAKPVPLTEAEKKALRDARYAARKSRVGKR